MIEQQVVINPGFEVQNLPDGTSPAGWSVDPNHQVMDNTPGTAYSGTWCARFSGWGLDSSTDFLYQNVDVPEFGIALLAFNLSIVDSALLPDNPASPSCVLTLAVQDKDGFPIKDLGTWDVRDPMTGSGWQTRGIYDLSEYAGSIIRLVFSSNQNNGAQNTTFFVDEVRLNVLLNLPISSFPPLISSMSRDLLDQIQQYGDRVYCSCILRAEIDDQFFNPSYAGGLTGYGANGSYYANGIENEAYKAAWWHEAAGGGDAVTRGGNQPFPATSVVLVTDSSISILDQADNLSLWMIFKKKPDNAYSDTFNLHADARFIPIRADYSSGVVTITFEPAPGSPVTSAAVLSIDFVQDFIYLDVSMV